MSIAAIITQAFDGDDPRLILEALPDGDGPGQPCLHVVNDPCPPLNGLVGLKIWGSANCIMSGETKIADRVGYTRIRLVERPDILTPTTPEAVERFERAMEKSGI